MLEDLELYSWKSLKSELRIRTHPHLESELPKLPVTRSAPNLTLTSETLTFSHHLELDREERVLLSWLPDAQAQWGHTWLHRPGVQSRGWPGLTQGGPPIYHLSLNCDRFSNYNIIYHANLNCVICLWSPEVITQVPNGCSAHQMKVIEILICLANKILKIGLKIEGVMASTIKIF